MNVGDLTIQLTLEGKDFDVRVKNAGAVLRQFEGDAKRTADSVNRLERAQESLGTKFRHLVVTMGNLRFVMMDLHDVFLRLPLAILRSAGELERTQVLVEGLSNKLTKAARELEGKQSFEFITDMAKKAPFALSAVQDSFVKLKSGGIDPMGGSLKALIDSVAKFGGDGESLKRASVAIQQMTGKGVVSMEELRQQLGEAMPSAMRSMATGMGLSMAELSKKISSGTVEATDAINKMLVILGQENQGAALRMMDTWVGALGALKTEWQLAAKGIADAGMGTAAKDALDKVRSELGTLEFQRFGAEFSRGVAMGINGLVAVVESGARAIDTLKTLAVAWLGYKLASSFVNRETRDGLFKGVGSLKAAMQAEVSERQLALDRAKAINVAKANDERKLAAEQVRASRQRIAALRAELVEQQALATQQAALAQRALADMQAAAAKRATLLGGSGTAGAPAQGGQTAALFKPRAAASPDPAVAAGLLSAQAAYNQATAAAETHARAVGLVNTQLAASKAAHTQLTGQLLNARAGFTAATAASSALGTAMTMGARAVGVLNTAFNALGGWFTVINLALSAGIALWMNWESAAEKAQKRAANAKLGLTNPEEVEAQGKLIAKLQADREKAGRAVQNLLAQGAGNAAAGSPLANALKKARIEEQAAVEELLNARGLQSEMVKVSDSNRARDEVASRMRSFDQRIEDILRAEQAALNAEAEAHAERMKAAAGNASKEEAERKRNSEALKQLRIKTASEQIAETEAAQKALKGRTDAAGLDQGRELTKRLEAYQADLASAKKSLQPNVSVAAKGDRAATPLERALIEEKAKLAELIALASELSKGAEHAEQITAKANAAAARIRSKASTGGFDYTDPTTKKKLGPDAKQVAELAETAKVTEGVRALVEAQQQVADRSKAIEPDYLRAMELIADPFGRVQSKRGNQFDEFLNKLKGSPEQLKEIADKAKISVEQLRADIDSLNQKAAAIDLSEIYSAEVQNSQKVEDELTGTDEERLRRRLEHEHRLHITRLNNALVEYRQRMKLEDGETDAIADKMRDQIMRSQDLGNKRIDRELRSPIEKVAEQWKDATARMNEATTRWGQQTIDTFVEGARTGKLEFGKLTESILADLLRIQVQAAMADAMKGAGGWLSKLGSAAIGYFSGGTSGGTGQPPGAVFDIDAFANGGVMTSMGPVALRKYAAGGIANSPQLALYGEGDMSEAYVPLPDGRTIPVTIKGQAGAGAAPAVTVNVINQTSQPVSAQQGAPRFDGKQLILDVVLSAASKPGTFRDGMKNAMTGA